YRGTPRDRIMLPLVKAFAYLGKGDEEGFRVELFRLRESQQAAMDANEKFLKNEEERLEKEKADNPDAAGSVDQEGMLRNEQNAAIQTSLAQTRNLAHSGYGNCMNPFAVFMSAYGFARENDFENALVDYQRLFKIMPANQMVQQYLATTLRRTGREVPAELATVPSLDFVSGQGTVLVVFANGRGPALREVSLHIPIIIPRHSSLVSAAWPVCEYYQAPFSTAIATTDEKTFSTVTIAAMDAILAQEYTQAFPSMITRMIVNVAVKEIAYQLAMESVRNSDPWTKLFVDLFGTTYKLTFNTADTRCWETLPKEYQIAEFPMPANRKLRITTDGRNATDISFPDNAKSAIIYVNAPSLNGAVFTCRVFPITTH
ncbi:MAG: hypothetical protein J6X55_02650, partial [Victivallales bacterium]|nr:hypothetical protein [Victivallales bacterium]